MNRSDAHPWGMVGSDWTGAMMPSKPCLFQTCSEGVIKIDSREMSLILASVYHALTTLLRRSVNSTNSDTDFVYASEKNSAKT